MNEKSKEGLNRRVKLVLAHRLLEVAVTCIEGSKMFAAGCDDETADALLSLLVMRLSVCLMLLIDYPSKGEA